MQTSAFDRRLCSSDGRGAECVLPTCVVFPFFNFRPREAKLFTRSFWVPKQLLGEVRVLFTLQNAPLTPS